MAGNGSRMRNTTQVIINPPTFSPPPEMRRQYLGRLQAQTSGMIGCGKVEDWKPVATIVNHVRGTGAMYGFTNIGNAAETLARAIQNGDSKRYQLLEAYANTVNQSYV